MKKPKKPAAPHWKVQVNIHREIYEECKIRSAELRSHQKTIDFIQEALREYLKLIETPPGKRLVPHQINLIDERRRKRSGVPIPDCAMPPDPDKLKERPDWNHNLHPFTVTISTEELKWVDQFREDHWREGGSTETVLGWLVAFACYWKESFSKAIDDFVGMATAEGIEGQRKFVRDTLGARLVAEAERSQGSESARAAQADEDDEDNEGEEWKKGGAA